MAEEAFVWLPENEKYLEIKEKTEKFYHKGYLGEVDAVHVNYVEDQREDVYYTTMMSLGNVSATTVNGEKGFVFYEAFEKYQEEIGIELKIQWFQYPEMKEDALRRK